VIVTYLSLGFVLITVGLGAVFLALAFRASGGRTLLAFGAFVVLYGIRLLAMTGVLPQLLGLSLNATDSISWLVNYWTPVPALIYTEQIRGPGWRLSLRRLWQAWIPLALALTAADAILGEPGAFRLAYLLCIIVMVLVILPQIMRGSRVTIAGRRIQRVGAAMFLVSIVLDNLAGIWWPDTGMKLEAIGVSAFIGTLAFVTGQEFFARERERAVVEHEMDTARGIQASILPARGVSLAALQIAACYVPMRGIAGDLYDFHVLDEHRVGVLVADVTGHGVPAALIASMVKVAFTAQRALAAEPGKLLAGMNQALCGNLTGQFVTAAYVFIDTERRELRYSLAGHPPPIVWRSATRTQAELAERAGLLMGFDTNASYSTCAFPLERRDRVLLFTDGLTEAQNAAGVHFGDAQLEGIFARGHGVPTDAFAGSFVDGARAWAGRADSQPFTDDLTVVVIDVN
jgi:sigma-B regulation protein RsbU (phosphoserine phosphatase)